MQVGEGNASVLASPAVTSSPCSFPVTNAERAASTRPALPCTYIQLQLKLFNVQQAGAERLLVRQLDACDFLRCRFLTRMKGVSDVMMNMANSRTINRIVRWWMTKLSMLRWLLLRLEGRGR